jgi:hypothetical protein
VFLADLLVFLSSSKAQLHRSVCRFVVERLMAPTMNDSFLHLDCHHLWMTCSTQLAGNTLPGYDGTMFRLSLETVSLGSLKGAKPLGGLAWEYR